MGSMGNGGEGGGRKKQFKGVRRRSWGTWVSEIRAPNKRERIWLGSYSTAEAAARAYDAALFSLKGSSAQLNFPDEAGHPLYTTSVLSPKAIKKIAAAAAAEASLSTSCQDPLPLDSSSEVLSSSVDGLALEESGIEGFSLDFGGDFFISGGCDFSPCVDEWVDGGISLWNF